MDIFSIIIIIIIAIIILEISKHMLTRTALKLIIVIIVVMVIFFAVLSSLSINDSIKTDNKYIQTGASIAKNINDEPLIVEIKGKIGESFEKLKNNLADSLKSD